LPTSRSAPPELLLLAVPPIRPYRILGSLSGTSPGIVLGRTAVPLNIDTYLRSTVLAEPSVPITDQIGVLDASGTATAALSVPSGLPPSLAGLSIFHAFVVSMPGTHFAPILASNPTTVTLGN
jgi:hypothetical protein